MNSSSGCFIIISCISDLVNIDLPEPDVPSTKPLLFISEVLSSTTNDLVVELILIP